MDDTTKRGASIPAMITLGVKAIAKPTGSRELEGGESGPPGIPPRV